MWRRSLGLGLSLLLALSALPAMAAEHTARPVVHPPVTAGRAHAVPAPAMQPRARSMAPPVYTGQPGRSWSGGHDTHPAWNRHGHWWHGRHHGALGWWFFYDDLYPGYGVWPYAGLDTYPYFGAPPASPPPGAWYWCQSAGAYWPYVRRCAEGWQVVVPQPVGP